MRGSCSVIPCAIQILSVGHRRCTNITELQLLCIVRNPGLKRVGGKDFSILSLVLPFIEAAFNYFMRQDTTKGSKRYETTGKRLFSGFRAVFGI
jgi:hypothetical protein